ncbi:isochorismatase family protein [Streptomyces spinosirectus]
MRQHDVEYIAVAGMIGLMCVESTARSCMEYGFHVTAFTDATAAFGGRPAYDALILRYPHLSHAALSVEVFLLRPRLRAPGPPARRQHRLPGATARLPRYREHGE